MKILEALGSGFIGACVLTVLHESARRVIPEAPRADILGVQVIKKVMQAGGKETPSEDRLHDIALVGDMVTNSLYYSLVCTGGRNHALTFGAALGTAAGIAVVALPEPLCLGKEPTARTPTTMVMTVGWYLTAGLAAAAAYKLLDS